VLDLGLPEIDGLTVLDRWRKEGRKMPVLVLTARDSWSDKVAGLDAGADDYLAKPFQTEELIARLRALIRRGRQARTHGGRHPSRHPIGQGPRLGTGRPMAQNSAGATDAPWGRWSRTELMSHLRPGLRDSNTLICQTRIRRKLGADVITTIGLGYSLEDSPLERPPQRRRPASGESSERRSGS
jgi:two-component system OmpR family response regulator